MAFSQHRAHDAVLVSGLLLLGVSLAGCQQRTDAPGEEPQPVELDSGNVLEGDELYTAATSMEEMIEGRLAGVFVRRFAGTIYIEIRGPSTITGSNQALIVIDGVQSSGATLLSMNPDDVDRIEVLKGASAATYGLRGANGVLLVTTRRP